MYKYKNNGNIINTPIFSLNLKQNNKKLNIINSSEPIK